jgi:hypothetical protein
MEDDLKRLRRLLG